MEAFLAEEDDEVVVAMATQLGIMRSSALYRRRWDETYLHSLAESEGSFVAEYRFDPNGFNILHELLDHTLQLDARMVNVQSGQSQSSPITTGSRLGAALIMLGDE
jgi:hypothetical protein